MDKVKVKVAWDRASTDIVEELGWEKAEETGNTITDTIEFNTLDEARAYTRGIADGNGWDNPFYEIINP